MRKGRNILLYPLSLLYGLVTSARNFLYDIKFLKSYEFDSPVICVGNITAGGTGKTPHTEYLIDLLSNDFNVAILSRGYKRKTRGFLLADPTSRVSHIGDEPFQIFRKYPRITVAVNANRVEGIRKILELRPGTNVILLDDGFQHRRIVPGISILLSDFSRLITDDFLLPFGDLRESIKNLKRADIIIITKSPPDLSPIQRRLVEKSIYPAPYQKLLFSSISYLEPLPVFDDVKPVFNLNTGIKDTGRSIVLVTGIANPSPLIGYVRKYVTEVQHLDFGDHHNYSSGDVEKITKAYSSLKTSEKYILTTEKDAVRLREFSNIAETLKSVFYFIPVSISFLDNYKTEFDNLIIDYVRKNKRNNRISQVKRND